MFDKQSMNPGNVETIQCNTKKMNDSSNADLASFMEQDEDLYEELQTKTLDDHDSLSSENMNSFNKTTYMRNDEVMHANCLDFEIFKY